MHCPKDEISWNNLQLNLEGVLCWWVLEGVTSNEADISHPEKVTQIWQTERERERERGSHRNPCMEYSLTFGKCLLATILSQTYIHTFCGIHTHKQSWGQKHEHQQQLSHMLYIIHLCFKYLCVPFLYIVLLGKSPIWHFQDTDSEADFRFPPLPAFSWKQNICRKYLAARESSHICAHSWYLSHFSISTFNTKSAQIYDKTVRIKLICLTK